MKAAEVKVTCPNCGEQIPIDEKAYHSIVNEVCNIEVDRRVNEMKAEMTNAFAEKVEAIKVQAESEYQNKLEKTRRHFVELRERANAKISDLQSRIDSSEKDKAIAVNNAVKCKDEEISSLNAAMRSLADDKRNLALELEAEKSKSVDIAAFESDLDIFKDSISKNTVLARKHSNDVIKQIDRFIIALEKHKEKVLAWQKQAELAEKKAENLSLKSLAIDNPTVTALIEAECDSSSDVNAAITDVEEADIEILPDDVCDAA